MQDLSMTSFMYKGQFIMKELKHVCSETLSHNVLQGITLTLKYCSHPFLPSFPSKKKKKKNSKSVFMSNPPQNFGELDTSP